ncbi:helix-turn-helix domain-containing protein [Halomicroarcula sp. GCM10025324]|uniref:winged helix-turn-helix domain-containing protein n=1 Tax=Haloarcula TaxID=2237 RepID=UPI0023E88F77|nr:helix-turn-helix domain-containing protein [Halomicroarcula sp. ZS-22-S1]
MSREEQPDQQPIFDSLADRDCRRILATLDEPLPAKAVANACELPQTTTYRKLQQLCEAGLVDDRTELRSDGHHTTTYVRDCAGIFVTIEGDEQFDVDLFADRESPSERLARLWTRIGEEL